MNKKEIGSAIWRMDQALQDINEELMENGGDLTPELQARLEGTELTAGQVADSLQQLISKSKAEGAILKDEVKRLQTLKKTRANAVEGLKKYLLGYMDAHGITKIEGTFAKVTRVAGVPCVNVNQDELLSSYQQDISELRKRLPSWVTLDVGISKDALLDFIKESGITPDGAFIEKHPFVKID